MGSKVSSKIQSQYRANTEPMQSQSEPIRANQGEKQRLFPQREKTAFGGITFFPLVGSVSRTKPSQAMSSNNRFWTPPGASYEGGLGSKVIFELILYFVFCFFQKKQAEKRCSPEGCCVTLGEQPLFFPLVGSYWLQSEPIRASQGGKQRLFTQREATAFG